MLLADVATTSREIAATSSRTEKSALLAALFRETAPDEAPLVVTYLAGRLPQRRTGLGWSTLKDRPPPAASPALTVQEVDAALDRISALAGKGAGSERKRLAGELMAAATEEEQRFLLGLITGEVRQGALDAAAVEGLAEAAGVPAADVRRAVMLGGSLGTVAEALLGGGAGALAAFRLDVGRPVLPMLAQTAKDVDEALDRLGPCAVEEKLDGIRVQVHRDGDEVRVFTRTLDEITGRLPEVVAAARELTAERAILDGEVIALDREGRPRQFQDIMRPGRLAAGCCRCPGPVAAVSGLFRSALGGRPRPARPFRTGARRRARPGGAGAAPGAAGDGGGPERSRTARGGTGVRGPDAGARP